MRTHIHTTHTLQHAQHIWHTCTRPARYCHSPALRLPLAQTPLMKALTGVELLLRACHEWDRNAHKGVAMKEGLQELTEVVLRWRRMELLCWPHGRAPPCLSCQRPSQGVRDRFSNKCS